MELTKNDLLQYVYDPNIVQKNILEFIEKASNGQLVITDPTNPFTMLLEAAAVTSANSAIEARSVMRKKYPSLANTPDELMHHLSDSELANMFAIPSNAYIVFYINLIDLKNNGYRPTDAKYVETIIPMYTEVKILETTFTLLNEISIKLYDSGSIFIEQKHNDEDIAINDLGILQNTIISDNAGVSYIIFETKVKQVKRLVSSGTVISGANFTKLVSINDSYFYSNVKYKNSTTNNNDVKLNKYHNEEYIDASNPSVYINIANKEILYKIPDTYIIEGQVNGTLTIETFETKGKLYLPINKYSLADFKITLGDTTTNATTATINNIAIMANSKEVVDGGSDSISTADLKNSIIFNSTGDIDLPITYYNISRMTSFDGFEIFKAIDVLTERLYIATKNMPEIESTLLNARQDLFFNKVSIELDKLKNNDSVYINNDLFIIKSNTLFKENNGIVTVVDQYEKEAIAKLTNIEVINFFRDKKYFYTPYYYVIDKEENNTKSRVYDLDNPSLSNLKIVGKNNNINQKCNIDKFAITKIPTGYRIYLTLISNEEFKQLDITMLRAQLTIPLYGNNSNVYIDGNYNPDTGYLTFDIETNLYVNSNGYMDLINGVSTIYNKLINLDSTCTVHLFTLDPAIRDETRYLKADIYVNDNPNITVLSKEQIEVVLGTELKYIFNRMFTSYTDRKYVKHLVDVPMVYEEDVYAVDPKTGCTLSCDGTNLTYNILHKKGDPVLDKDGIQLFKHRAGDVLIGENGLPIIDRDAGVIRYLDIVMFEYIFKLANSNAHVNYLTTSMDVLNTWLVSSLKNINGKLLENTVVLFKSYKSAKNVSVSINNIRHTIPYSVKPVITIYTTTSGYDVATLNIIKNKIGKILHNHLDKYNVILADIKAEIQSVIGSDIVGVKITGLDNLGNLEALTIADKTTRLTINKILDLNKNNELIVNYDVELSIQSI